jgi:hypothetical protein
MRRFKLWPARKGETLLDEIDQMQKRITERAYELLIKADIQHSHPEAKGIVHVCEFQPGQLFRGHRGAAGKEG